MSKNKIQEYAHGLYGKKLSIDLTEIKKSCQFMERAINHKFPDQIDDEIIPQSTKKYRNYNILLHPSIELHALYFEIQEMFYKCSAIYRQKRVEPYYIQSWLNVYNKGEYIDWHGHWDPQVRAWHGFFCVDVEPDSYTSYTWDNEQNILNVQSVDNLLVLGTSNNDLHKSSEWKQEYPRITIAFDIVPKSYCIDPDIFRNNDLKRYCSDPICFNHWIPI